MRLRVGITYNLKKDFAPSDDQPIDALEEFDAEETIDAIQHVLEGDGHDVTKLGGGPGLIDRLRKTPVDMVFNIAEGMSGRCREAQVPCILEAYGIGYTFSDPLVCAATLDKSIAKRLLREADVVAKPDLDVAHPVPGRFSLCRFRHDHQGNVLSEG